MELERLGIHESTGAVLPPDRLVAALADAPIDVRVTGDDGVEDCDAVVTLEHRDGFLDLEWLHSIQAGVDRFPLDALESNGVALTNSAGLHGRTVGETVAGYLLAFSRRLHRHVADQQRRRWERPPWHEAFTLPGTTACVLGTGTLGRGVADVVGALGVEVIGVRQSADPVPGFDRIHPAEGMLEAVADVEFVVSTLPLTDATRRTIDADVFAAMSADARFVNVGRGEVVDEDALIAALHDGEIAGAALDVFEAEPLPEDSPLWGIDEVIVTPHAAAFTRDYYREQAELVGENVDRLGAGETLRNRVV